MTRILHSQGWKLVEAPFIQNPGLRKGQLVGNPFLCPALPRDTLKQCGLRWKAESTSFCGMLLSLLVFSDLCLAVANLTKYSFFLVELHGLASVLCICITLSFFLIMFLALRVINSGKVSWKAFLESLFSPALKQMVSCC